MLLALPPPQSQGIDAPAMRITPLDRRRIEAAVGLTERRRSWTLRGEYLWRALWHRLPALLPVLLFVPIVLAPPLNQDVAAILQFSQRWLAGEHLYSDLIDVNPPLIFVLNLLPAAIAAITKLDAIVALQLCLFAYGGFCWWLAMRVRDRGAEGPVVRAFVDVLPGLFLLTAGYDFGQREHLMVVAALPYLLAAVRRAAGETPRGRVAVGLLAGVAFALKPHFLGVPALAELYVLLARRPADAAFVPGLGMALRRSLRDPLPWLMAGVWAVYLASLPLLFPDYIATVVPLVWGFYLGGLTVWQLLVTPSIGAVVCLLLPLLFPLVFPLVLPVLRPRSVRLHPFAGALPRLLALAAVAALAAMFMQHKGWSYHILPVQLFTCGLAGVLAAGWLDRRLNSAATPTPYTVAAVLGWLFALFVVSNGPAPWRELSYPNDQAAGLTALLEREVAGERVLVLSPDVYPIYPALNYAGVQSTSRAMDMWLLRGAYQTCPADGRRDREVWEMGRPEFFVYRTVAEDFARSPPAAVLIDTVSGVNWCGSEFDFIAYFKRHPLFAEVWSHYKLTAEWGRYRLYTPKD
jgi:hypothetical protein